MKIMLKAFLIILSATVILSAIVFCYFFVGKVPVSEKITWGVDFSQMQAESLGLNWKDVYSNLIEDLGVKHIKIHTQWDWVEGNQDEFYFNDIDWQLQKAKENEVKIIYVVGMKTGRWPECHVPKWASNLPEQQQKEAVLGYIEKVVQRYKNNDSIVNWQVENEPLFKFGECPAWYYKDSEFLKQEIELVKSLDLSREIIVSDSGEQSMWLKVGKVADVVGITMYRRVWFHITDKIGFNFNFMLPPVNYYRRAEIIRKLYNKNVICVELQAEPWSSKPFYDVPLDKQAETMDLEIFKQNIEYARETGLDKFYLWGAEWWYWMKTTQNMPQIWQEAQKLFAI